LSDRTIRPLPLGLFAGCRTVHGFCKGRGTRSSKIALRLLQPAWNYLTCNSSLRQNPPTLMIPHLPTQGEGPAVQAALPPNDYVQPTLGHGGSGGRFTGGIN
jgi:hypothetical protein